MTLTQVSSDYVYDGFSGRPYTETEPDPIAPLGVHGQTKAAGNQIAPRYIIRTRWVIGDGRNFVGTMANLAERGVDPLVVADQTDRLTSPKTSPQAPDICSTPVPPTAHATSRDRANPHPVPTLPAPSTASPAPHASPP